MKKNLAFVLVAVIAATVFLTGCPQKEEIQINYAETTANIDYSELAGTEVRVYNWGYYISDGSDGSIDVNEEFEKLTGIKVVYDNYDSNESLYAKLSGGGADYDVVIPSDYMIGRLIEEGYLAELDFNNIPNYKFISDKYKNMDYDPDNKFSVPYNVGMVGVIYNTKTVEGTPTSWSLMWDENYKGKILNFNNSRDAFAIAQFYMGLDINSENTEEWDKAFEKLKEQKNILQSYVMDEIFNKMESGEAAIAPYYAGDFFTMYGNNNDLAFYYPQEGTNQFVDAACILKDAKNKKAAELYINFLLDPEIGKANAEYMYYASPNTAVIADEEYREFLDELHPDAYDILYQSSEKVPTGAFRNLSPEMKDYLGRKWTELGAAATDDGGNSYIYIITGAVVAVLIGILVYGAIKKQKKKKAENED